MRLSIIAILTLLPSSLAAQGALTGIVRDDSTGAPLSGVEVVVNRTALRATTGTNGRYLLSGIPAGRHEAIFRLVGRLPARHEVLVADGDTIRVNTTLVRAEVVLDPIEVIGENPRPRGTGLEAFEERRRMGFGRFIDSTELRRAEHLHTADVLQRHGIMVGMAMEGIRFAINPRNRRCAMSLYVDGRLAGEGGLAGTSTIDFPGLDLRLYRTHELAAIEVYLGAGSVPVQFGGRTGACGAVVLWTRRGM